MPPRSKVETLPADIRDALDSRLRSNGYGDLVALASWLNREHGIHIGKSSLGVYALELKSKDRAVSMIARDMREDLSDRESVDLLLELGALRVKEQRILKRLEEIGYL